ncbi:MAG: response regulator [Oscillochloris sp.]|nr:response regulator [Oscillochloris sp.]
MLTMQHSPGEGAVARPSSGSVIIIDDEEAVRAVLVKMIMRLGYRVYEADAGSEGLAALHQIDDTLVALLVDMTMPQMNGAEVARAALSLRPDLPVVLMSGHSGEALVREHGLVGQVRVLQKPFSFNMVRDTLAHCRSQVS